MCVGQGVWRGLCKWCRHLAHSLWCGKILKMLSLGALYHIHDGLVNWLALGCDGPVKGG